MADTYTIKVLTNISKQNKKQSFSFTVDTAAKVKDHIRQLATNGYYRVAGPDKIDWIPPHSITGVRATGPGLALGYEDTDTSE